MEPISNRELGHRIGVSPSMASRLRNGHRTPSMPVLRRLVKAFDLSLDDAVRASSEGAVAFGRFVTQAVGPPDRPAQRDAYGQLIS